MTAISLSSFAGHAGAYRAAGLIGTLLLVIILVFVDERELGASSCGCKGGAENGDSGEHGHPKKGQVHGTMG